MRLLLLIALVLVPLMPASAQYTESSYTNFTTPSQRAPDGNYYSWWGYAPGGRIMTGQSLPPPLPRNNMQPSMSTPGYIGSSVFGGQSTTSPFGSRR